MRKKINNFTLRTQIIVQNCVMVIVICMVCMGVLSLGIKESKKVEKMLNYKILTSDYFSTIEELDHAILDYMNTGSNFYLKESKKLISQLTLYADQMKTYYKKPEFEDQYYRTLSFQYAIEQFLNSEEILMSETSMELYQIQKHQMKLLSYNESLLLSVEKQIIIERMSQFTEERQTRMIAVFCMLTSLLLIGMQINQHLADQITAPLVALTTKIQQVISSIQKTEISGEKVIKNEIYLLNITFSKMINTIFQQMQQLEEQYKMLEKFKNIEVENMKMKMQLAQSELRVVQSLMKPHFLYNCLTSISALAYLEDAIQTQKASNLVADFLRSALGRIGEISTIDREIRYIQKYIEIQKLRFGERISSKMQCDAVCMPAKIPAMILQPFVENAIVHGIGSSGKKGNISLKVEKKGERLFIYIKDSGKISREKADEIERMVRKENLMADGKNLGIKSAVLQLRMFFKQNIELYIRSENQTNIILNLPFQTEAVQGDESIEEKADELRIMK